MVILLKLLLWVLLFGQPAHHHHHNPAPFPPHRVCVISGGVERCWPAPAGKATG